MTTRGSSRMARLSIASR